jgi:N-glycosylase/DNA lyase
MMVTGMIVEQAVRALCPDVARQIESRSSHILPETRLWEELVCCVLSSQVQYEVALAATRRLRGLRVFSDIRDGVSPSRLRPKIYDALSRVLRVDGRPLRYRFPRSKASQLATTVRAISECSGGLAPVVYSVDDDRKKRRRLIDLVCGFGPKQASMFLRNCGVSYGLAVLDRHTLRFMAAIGLVRERDSGHPTTLNQYERLESIFNGYSADLGYPSGYVDWAVWIVMREATGPA